LVFAAGFDSRKGSMSKWNLPTWILQVEWPCHVIWMPELDWDLLWDLLEVLMVMLSVDVCRSMDAKNPR
jgi:hypothetical protein